MDTLCELVDVIGEPATLALLQRYAGTRLLVPLNMFGDHPIAVAIGIDAASKLSNHYAPDVINVPLGRELRARHMRRSGYSHAQIAVALGLTEGGALRLVRRLGDNDSFAAPGPETLIGLIGKGAVLSLVTAFGGAHLDMPPNAEDRAALVDAIGTGATDALAAAYPEGVVEIPVAREFRALAMRANGETTSRIATALCITERDVARIFREAHAFMGGR